MSKKETITLKPKQGYCDNTTGFSFRNNKPYPVTYTFDSCNQIILNTERAPEEQADKPEPVGDSYFEDELRELFREYEVTGFKTST